MMPVPPASGSEDPDLFRVRRPTRTEAAVFALFSMEAADLAGFIPESPLSGAVVITAATAVLIKQTVRRR